MCQRVEGGDKVKEAFVRKIPGLRVPKKKSVERYVHLLLLQDHHESLRV
jgi:hypothetical protein